MTTIIKLVNLTIMAIGVLVTGPITAATASEPLVIYVSPDGSDTSPGTPASPLRSLNQALAISAQSAIEQTIVRLYPGDYPLIETLKLSTSANNTQIIATNPGVIIHGGQTIDAEYISKVTDPAILDQLIEISAKNNLWVVNLASAGITDYGSIGPRGFGRPSTPSDLRLSVAGVALYPAQWPNRGQVGFTIGKVITAGGDPRNGGDWNEGGSFLYSNERISKWKNKSDAWLHGFFNHGYADDLIGIDSIDTALKKITMAQAAFYSIQSGNAWNKAYGIHLLSEIDEPGEFFLDRVTGLCYFMPPENSNPVNGLVLAPIMDKPLIDLNDCKNITFKGIVFEQTRGTGITINKGFNNQFVGCIIRNTGGNGITIAGLSGSGSSAEGTMQHVVSDCDIFNTGTGGISINAGDRITLNPAGVLVKNCHIHDNNSLEKTYRPAISLSGVGNKVQNCEIHDILGAAVLFSGNDNILELNEIYNAMTYGDDMGVCYTGRNITSFGNKIRANYIHDCGNTGNVSSVYSIYIDDGACGTQVYKNIFRNSAKAQVFLIGGGSYNQVYNNLSIDNPVFMRVDNRLASWAAHLLDNGGQFRTQFTDVKADVPPWSVAYPELAGYWNNNPAVPKNTMKDNLLVRNAGELIGTRSWVSGNVSTIISPPNTFQNWKNKSLAQDEINTYLTSKPGMGSPSLSGVGLQSTSWRSAGNIHKAQANTISFNIREKLSDGTVVGTVIASDINWGEAAGGLAILGGNTNGAFSLDPTSGALTVANSAELTPGSMFELCVQATDTATPPTTTNSTIAIFVRSLDENLLAYWKMDDARGTTSMDNSGNAHHGTFMGTPVWGVGHLAGGLTTNGVSDGVNVDKSASITGTGGFTLSAWVKSTGSTKGRILQQRDTEGTSGQYSLTYNSNGTIGFSIYNDGYQFDFSTNSAVDDGNWHHVAAVRDGTNGYIYIDGLQAATASGPIKNLLTHQISIGYDVRDMDYFFDGGLDDMRIYNDTLIASQIAALAAAPANTAPIANNASFIVSENMPIGSLLGSVTATDADIGDSLTFSIIAGNTHDTFFIDPKNGEITVAGIVDSNLTLGYYLTVSATDQRGAQGLATITIRITDTSRKWADFNGLTAGTKLSGQGSWDGPTGPQVVEAPGTGSGYYGFSGNLVEYTGFDARTNHPLSGFNDTESITMEMDLRINGDKSYSYWAIGPSELSLGVEYGNLTLRGANGGTRNYDHDLPGDKNYHLSMTIQPTAFSGAGSATVTVAEWTDERTLGPKTTVFSNVELNLNASGNALSGITSTSLRLHNGGAAARVDNLSISQGPIADDTPVPVFIEHFDTLTSGISLSGQDAWGGPTGVKVVANPGSIGFSGKIAENSGADNQENHPLSGLNDVGLMTMEFDVRISGDLSYTYWILGQSGISIGVEYGNLTLRGTASGTQNFDHNLTGDGVYHIVMAVDPTAYDGAGTATSTYAKYTAENTLGPAQTAFSNVPLNLDIAGKRLSENTNFVLRLHKQSSAPAARADNLSIVQVPLSTVQAGYANWTLNYPGLIDTSANLDFDHDGLMTGIEWIVGGNPTANDAASVAPTLDIISDPNKCLYTYRRSHNSNADTNTTIMVEYSWDLVGWRNTIDHGASDGVTVTEIFNIEPAIDEVTVALPKALGSSDGKLFVRLKVMIAT